MNRKAWCTALVWLLAASSTSSGQSAIRLVKMTRVVRIPVRLWEGDAVAQNANPGILTVSAGATDELPEGPDAFEVLEGGDFLITDPLRKRIVDFSSQGVFVRDWKIGYPADSIAWASDGLLQVRVASTGEIHIFDRQGNARPAAAVRQPETPEARLAGPNAGTVGAVAVSFERPGLRLVSLGTIGSVDGDHSTYVILEATAGGDTVNVNEYIRKYDASGKPVCEIEVIPADSYVRPTNEFRVRKGVVYQLETTKSEVHINAWDTH